MTRKDYILLAQALNTVYANALNVESSAMQALGVRRAAHAIADVLASDNPRFDRARFMRAVEGNGN